MDRDYATYHRACRSYARLPARYAEGDGWRLDVWHIESIQLRTDIQRLRSAGGDGSRRKIERRLADWRTDRRSSVCGRDGLASRENYRRSYIILRNLDRSPLWNQSPHFLPSCSSALSQSCCW